MVGTIQRILRGLDQLLEWVIASVMAILALLVASQFVDRYIVDVPLSAPDVYVRVGLAWLTFVGFAAAVRAGENIRIELADHVLGERGRQILAVSFDAILLVLLGLLLVKGWTVFEVGEAQQLIGTPLTAAVPAGALVIGCLLLTLFVALRLAARLAGSSAVEPPHGDPAVKRDPV